MFSPLKLCGTVTMPLLHSYILPFSITRLSRAHNLTSYRTFSAFGLSYLTSTGVHHKLRKKKDYSDCSNLKVRDTLLIKNQFVPSSTYSTLISTRSNVHFKLLFQDRAIISSGIQSKMSYTNEQRGSLYNDDFRLYFKESSGAIVSPMHDIPLK